MTKQLELTDSIDAIVMRDNELVVLDDKFQKIQTQVQEITAVLSELTITDDNSITYARELATNANKIIKQIETRRLQLTKPINERKKRIDDFAKSLKEPIERQVNRIRQLLANYEADKQKRLFEEKQRLEREAKKREAERERERIKKAEMAKKIDNDYHIFMKRIQDAKKPEWLQVIENDLQQWKRTDIPDALKTTFNNYVELITNDIPKRKTEIEKEMELEAERKKISQREYDIKQKELEQKRERERLVKLKEEASLAMKRVLAEREQNERDNKIREMQNTVHQQAISNIDKQSEQTKNMRKVYDIEIVSPDLVPRQYCTPDISKIRDAVKLTPDIKIDGVKITEKRVPILR